MGRYTRRNEGSEALKLNLPYLSIWATKIGVNELLEKALKEAQIIWAGQNYLKCTTNG